MQQIFGCNYPQLHDPETTATYKTKTRNGYLLLYILNLRKRLLHYETAESCKTIMHVQYKAKTWSTTQWAYIFIFSGLTNSRKCCICTKLTTINNAHIATLTDNWWILSFLFTVRLQIMDQWSENRVCAVVTFSKFSRNLRYFCTKLLK